MSIPETLRRLNQRIRDTAAAVDAARATGDQTAIAEAIAAWNDAHATKAQYVASYSTPERMHFDFWRADD